MREKLPSEMIREEAEANLRVQIERSRHQITEHQRQSLMLEPFRRAVSIAYANNYKPVRWVISRRMWRRLGGVEPSTYKIYGLPLEVDEDVDVGFGLVTRPPQRETMQDQQGGANDH